MNQITRDAMDYIRTLYAGNADRHGYEHSLRVWRNAMAIAGDEAGCDQEIVSLAALLHDADDNKLFSTKNNANARRFLEAHRIPTETTDRICAVINAVSFRRNRGNARIPRRAGPYRTRTGWMPSAPSGLPGPSLMVESMAGPRRNPSRISMRNCC